MTIDPNAGTAALGAAKAPKPAQATSIETDYQNFLQLLTAQISNQDPLEPMDATTFVSQLAQLSQVEQAVRTNTNLEQISGNLSALSGLSTAGMIGRDVRVPTSEIVLSEEGGASLSYRLDREAANVRATIRHPDGTAIAHIDDLPREAATEHEVAWDGIALDGLPVPAGTYRIEIDATDAEGEAITLKTFSEARVESVLFRDGQTRLELATGQEISPEQVVELR
ncbi:flagellar hook assembly protein FlgD [Roseivivax halodurans JCM 10272]|uniref:Basal-body rod modification protein FlgD n=1 Tax=Roseivivax halodurans JCM 10272 TaxID=1449350 RepID=X7EMC8_9RHOB|nr:flagellar hook capping FlgD N-terminal domain-containing protein [Roseivivax halodurans]ETX16321.1 flagellar hook assembly protein FlgD [Roseivivax halodurans JCM 10272]